MPGFDPLSEVILYVDDVERMTSFYTDVLGLDHVEGDPEHGFVKLDAGGTALCLHAGGEGDIGRDAPKVVFDVDDVDDAADYLADHDVELGDRRSPAPGVTVVDARDPAGHKFSIESRSQ